ncbi:MAG: NAD(P)H-binding protein [Opitutae bacterium]|nr:NAD(P)H-binding protein [Opitutae bacterium]
MGTALIAGASGLVGGELLQQLLRAHEYERVVAVGRRRLDVSHPKLTQVAADFAALEQVAADLRCTDAFCCLGTTIKAAGSTSSGRAGARAAFRAVDHAAVLAFAWAAQRAGAQRFFVVSALGADAGSRVFYNRVKGETEDALPVLGFSTLAIFRPSLLLGRRAEARLGERVLAAVLWLAEPLLVGRLRKYRAIQAEVVARAMVRTSFGRAGQGLLVYPSDQIQDLGGFGA